jgi:hypothetical protein
MAAALALLSCFGVWQALRHHPLYSPRSASWLLVKVVVMIGAAATLLFGAMLATVNSSLPVQLGVLVGAILIGTLGLVFGISAAATPRIARLQTKLPPRVPVVRLHRSRVTRWLRVALVYLAACALLALAPDPLRSMALVLGGLGLLLAGVMLPVGYMTALRLDRAVTVLEFDPWLHWQYPPEARSVWCKAQVERLKLKPYTFILRRDWLKLLGLCAVLVIPSLLLMPGSVLVRAGWGFFCCVLLGFFIELAAAEERRAPARLARRLKAAASDVWFGHDGLVCDGHFYTWIDTRVYLRSARIDWRPPRSLCFEFTNLSSGAYGSPVTGTVSQNVLIPPAVGADDLALLQAHLRTRCPDAEIKLAQGAA